MGDLDFLLQKAMKLNHKITFKWLKYSPYIADSELPAHLFCLNRLGAAMRKSL